MEEMPTNPLDLLRRLLCFGVDTSDLEMVLIVFRTIKHTEAQLRAARDQK